MLKLSENIKQYLIIIGLSFFFILTDVYIFHTFVQTNFNNSNPEMQAKSIELSDYLPFEKDSKVVHIKSQTRIEGKLPVLDGAAALYPVFSGVASSIYPENSVHFDGENFTSDSSLQYTNTRGAYQRIVDGDADIIFCAKPSEEQLAYAKEKNVELEMIPIGKEAFVFITHKDCEVKDLSADQIRGIYSGKYINWKQLGGSNKIIEPLMRNKGSGSQTAFLHFMGDTPVHKSFLAFLGKPIGFSFRYYVEGLVKDGDVQMLSLNGIYPSRENIANDTYPITDNFYAVYRKGESNENVKKVIDWILSDEGQELVEKSGYTKLNN